MRCDWRVLGYFSLPVLAALREQDVYWLTRLQAGTAIYDPSGERLDLLALLHPKDITAVDQAILVGSDQRLPCRLLAVRVPQAVADKRRQQLHTEAHRKGQTVSAKRLALADWTIFITNTPCDMLPLHDALTLARCRWQIDCCSSCGRAMAISIPRAVKTHGEYCVKSTPNCSP